MARHKVTFTVESPQQIFDLVAKAGSQALGDRCVSVLMTGEVKGMDHLGFSLYGIEVETQKLED